jgi:mycothiol system anti-sigma-R factor
MPSPCKQIQEQIAGYLDRELEPAQANTVSRHLLDCPGCAEEMNVQQKMKELVREHAPHLAAPAHVRAEVRRRLHQEIPGFGFCRQLQQLFQRKPLPALAAAVMLMLLSGVATYSFLPKPIQFGREAFVTGSIEGEIICIDCDLLDLLKTAYIHDATHRLGVRCADGHIWSIISSEKSKTLSVNMHRQVRITGRLFANMQYIEVGEFSFI